MSLLEDFLSWKNTWAIAPASVADSVEKLDYVETYQLSEAPSDRMIYYVKKVNRKVRFEDVFLRVLRSTI